MKWGVALLVCLLALPMVAGQGVRVLETGTEDYATAGAGEFAELTWNIAVVDGQDHPLLATFDSNAISGWEFELEPSFLTIPAGETGQFVLKASPGGNVEPRILEVTLMLEDPATNQTITATGTVNAESFGQVLGFFENPLPAPLDGYMGTFVLNVFAWILIALAVMLFISPSLKILTTRTISDVDDRIISIAYRPTFYLVLAYGIRQSLESLPLPGWGFRIVGGLWLVATVTIIVYAVYRLWQEVVLSYAKRMASKTASDVDDRLLPVFEKLGGIIIILVGFFYIADYFGWNMTWLAAGGAIGGLVIAFAAQDTLGNFFSGMHLLIDQPFKEGDDIILDTGEVCTVKRIGLRSLDLYHKANHEVIIVPNSLVAQNRIINIMQPDNLYKVKVLVGVAYGTDVQRVKQILLDIGASHPLSLGDEGHLPFVRFNEFGASSLDFSLTITIGDVYARFAVASDLREMIEQRFAEERVEIPFPQHVVWQGRDEADRDDPPRPSKRLKLFGSIEEATKDTDES